jgi:adenylosuccinate lyase
VAFGHSLVALSNLTTALGEIDVNPQAMAADLQANWEVLAEAIQTVIRAEIARGESSISDPYAVVKDLTRGHKISEEDLLAFVDGLDISQDQKNALSNLSPELYVGLAASLVDYLD